MVAREILKGLVTHGLHTAANLKPFSRITPHELGIAFADLVEWLIAARVGLTEVSVLIEMEECHASVYRRTST